MEYARVMSRLPKQSKQWIFEKWIPCDSHHCRWSVVSQIQNWWSRCFFEFDEVFQWPESCQSLCFSIPAAMSRLASDVRHFKREGLVSALMAMTLDSQGIESMEISFQTSFSDIVTNIKPNAALWPDELRRVQIKFLVSLWLLRHCFIYRTFQKEGIWMNTKSNKMATMPIP